MKLPDAGLTLATPWTTRRRGGLATEAGKAMALEDALVLTDCLRDNRAIPNATTPDTSPALRDNVVRYWTPGVTEAHSGPHGHHRP
jgi:hypothetical protein